MATHTVSCLDGPYDVPSRRRTLRPPYEHELPVSEWTSMGEREPAPRTAKCVGYRPPLDYARAVSKAVLILVEAQREYTKKLHARMSTADEMQAAAYRKDDALRDVLDLLYGAASDGHGGE